MARFEKKPLHKFSRIKSDLAELQRWWPVHIKDDGVLGISIDPVLYRSRFSEATTETDDESVQAGIRVEAIQDDGTDVSGTEPTIVIENAGTLNATCKINHSDGTTTVIRLVAPSHDKTNHTFARTDNSGVTTSSNTVSGTVNPKAAAKGYRAGPYPIFMTIQELAETIDTYRHIGQADDSGKKAWVPQYMKDNVHSPPFVRLPPINEDPRVAVSATANVAFPSSSPYRATVFMPMMLDNNQFSKNISGASTLWGNQTIWNKNGITRYDSQPDGVDSAVIDYKTVGHSGDHLLGLNYASIRGANSYSTTTQMVRDMAAVWSSQDTTDCPSPKYRMAMSLAAFLKNGTYKLNNGVIIPYVYDASRVVGGTNSDTLYMRWEGNSGVAATSATTRGLETPAGIYPYFDFVQGPICPRAQGSNWTNSVLADHAIGVKPLRFEVPPNVKKMKIQYVECVAVSSTKRQFRVYTINEASSTDDSGHTQYPFEVGDCVFIEKLSGNLGTGKEMTLESGRIWGSRYDGRRYNQATDSTQTKESLDCNGWWTISEVVNGDDDPANGVAAGQTRYGFNVRNLRLTTGYNPNNGVSPDSAQATMCGGRIGGPENGFSTKLYVKTDGTVADGTNDRLDVPFGTGIGNISMPMGGYGNFLYFNYPNGKPASSEIGTYFQCGMNQGDLNVPPASSRNSTYPSRITIGEYSVANANGDHIGDRPVPRSIAIQTLGVAPTDKLANSPPIVATGNGSLRIPAPIGHDLCLRYENTSHDGVTTGADAKNVAHTRWRVRSDLGQSSSTAGIQSRGGPDKWAWRGVSAALWSKIDSVTGQHAWDKIKPTGWTYGRNRAWPAHERLGTRLSMSPSLLPEATGWTAASGNLVEPAQETTKIGLSEMGCSPIFLDMQMTAFIPKRTNRMTIIEFDMNDADEQLGRHHQIYSTMNKDMGFGFKPIWNGTGQAGAFNLYGFQAIDGTEIATPSSTTKDTVDLIGDVVGPSTSTVAAAGNKPVFSGFSVDDTMAYPNGSVGNSYVPEAPYPRSASANRPAVWFTPNPTHWTANTWTDADAFTMPSEAGFGRMGTGFGQGTGFSYSEGLNTIRSVFTTGGMICIFNGETIGTDESAQEAVWGLQIKSCNVYSMADRSPFFLPEGGGTTGFVNSQDVIFPVYKHLSTEEPVVMLQIDGDIYNDAGVDTATGPCDKQYRGRDSAGGIESDWSLIYDFFPTSMPVPPDKLKDSANRMTRPDNPAVQTSQIDLQVDEIILRQIPTPAMLPFTVDTLKQQAPAVASGLARYTSILIEADNIDADKGMRVTVTLLEPPSGTGIAKEASTVITGFEDLDPDFIGGVGEVDLRGLPESAVVNGFVIRFNFYIPSSEQGDLHPIDWSATPIIRKYNVFFDHKPTAQNTVIGNTYDGSTATTVGQTTVQTFTTKVGHIVSFRLQGDTTDPDRKITSLKVDLGDGTITDFMPVTTPAQNVSLDISHVYSARPAGGTYDIKVYAMDDSSNESDYILIPNAFLRVTIVAAEPVAVVRAVPSMVRAGQAIRFDGSDSYSIDTSANLTNFAWTFGDGSTGVNGATSHQDHTYAAAGEYMATLIVTDSTGTQSPYAKAVVKVLPATLVVPLTLSTKPSSFTRTRTASISQTPILDAIYPEMTDMGNRGDEFMLTGMFLKETQETDIAFMEELLLSGALVEFEYQEVNYTGVADSKTFTGRMVSFDYNRQGGSLDTTPYTATFVREAGLGA